MLTQLETDLTYLLPFKDGSSTYIDVDKILANRIATIKLFYEQYYTKPQVDWLLNDYTLKELAGYDNQVIDWNIRNLKPFAEDFTIEKFWFKNTDSENTPYKNLRVELGSVIGFKDGVNSIFYQGDYLDGGEAYSKQKNPKMFNSAPEILDDTVGPNAESVKAEEASSGNFRKFIYAYFPPKLYLSPNKKAFFILTQGKHLLRSREQPVVRFYFNLKPNKIDKTNADNYVKYVENFKKRVNHFANTIEMFLNNRRIPFQFKLPISVENFQRVDTFVLYIAQKHYYHVYEFIRSHSQKFKCILGQNIPLFTQKFSDVHGVGIAEDPDVSVDSFGINRCRLVYEIVEKLSKNVIDKDKLTTKEIVAEVEKLGYKEGFFRNPFTKYDYQFVDNQPINLSNSYPFGTRFYLYFYGRVALNYALDFVEKAIWIDQNEITWLTYYQENNEKGYRLINPEERELIFWFLKQIVQFPWMRVYFPDHVIKIILKNSEYQNKVPEYWNNIQTDENSKEEFERVKESADKEFRMTWKSVWESTEAYAKNVEKYYNTILGIPEEGVVEEIYKIKKNKFETTEELSENARKIYYQYLKPLYPMKNGFGNYEYMPTDKGKLQIAMIMLYVYCPSVFMSVEPQKESSLKYQFQQGLSKFLLRL